MRQEIVHFLGGPDPLNFALVKLGGNSGVFKISTPDAQWVHQAFLVVNVERAFSKVLAPNFRAEFAYTSKDLQEELVFLQFQVLTAFVAEGGTIMEAGKLQFNARNDEKNVDQFKSGK